jgi:hypothetical protein
MRPPEASAGCVNLMISDVMAAALAAGALWCRSESFSIVQTQAQGCLPTDAEGTFFCDTGRSYHRLIDYTASTVGRQVDRTFSKPMTAMSVPRTPIPIMKLDKLSGTSYPISVSGAAEDRVRRMPFIGSQNRKPSGTEECAFSGA